MKLLAAPTAAGHQQPTPDNHVLVGELLLPAEQCDKPHCVSRREFVGVTTYARTIQAKVGDLGISDEQIRAIATGYVDDMFPEPPPRRLDRPSRALGGAVNPKEAAAELTVDVRSTTAPTRTYRRVDTEIGRCVLQLEVRLVLASRGAYDQRDRGSARANSDRPVVHAQ